MSHFLRNALLALDGNPYKLAAAAHLAEVPLTLQQFADATRLSHRTVQRLMPSLLAAGFLTVDKSRSPFTYAATTSWRSATTEWDSATTEADASTTTSWRSATTELHTSGLADGQFAPSLYLIPADEPKSMEGFDHSRGISLSLDTESLKDTVSKNGEADERIMTAYQTHNSRDLERWRRENVDYAQMSCRLVGDSVEGSLAAHISIWAHARRVDALHGARLTEQLLTTLRVLERRREKNGHTQGAAFTALSRLAFVQAGFPKGQPVKENKTDELEILAFRAEQARALPAPAALDRGAKSVARRDPHLYRQQRG
jgi:DNA-binding transcriptional ArsR family regulator